MGKQTHMQLVAFVIYAVVLIALEQPARSQISNGTIRGSVSDNQGAKVPDARIVVTNIETGTAITVRSDARGIYSAPDLAIGRYRIETQHDGFATNIAGPITLTVGQQAVIDVALSVGAVSETVSVDASAPQVETSDSSLRWVVGEDQMQNLPLNGRNFVQLTLLTPGIQPVPQENTEGASALVPFGFGSPQRFSVAGGRPQGQLFLLDGTDTAGVWGNGTGVNLAGTSLGVDAIAEFAALTNTYSANYGGNGGVINAVLRSGTNSFHGSVYEFVRNSALDARNYFDPVGGGALPFSRNQFGGTIGGPIRRDRTFFFANYEQLQQKLTTTVLTTVPGANFRKGFLPCYEVLGAACTGTTDTTPTFVGVNPNVAGYLAAYPAPNGADFSDGSAQNISELQGPVGEHYGVIKITHNLSTSNTLLASYNIDDGTVESHANPSVTDNDSQRNQNLTLEERKIISPKLLNVAHFSYVRSKIIVATDTNPAFTIVSGSGYNGNISVTGLGILGAEDSSIEAVNRYTVRDQVSLTKGRHSLDVGVEEVRHQLNANIPIITGGEFLYNAIPVGHGATLSAYNAFLTNTAFLFAGVPLNAADSTRNIRHTNLAGYVQDKWQATPRFTVNAGLRYDFETNPIETHGKLYNLTNVLTNTGYVHVDHAFASNITAADFQPRIGFAVDVFGNQKTSIRGGYGIFDDLPLEMQIAISYLFNPPIYNVTEILLPSNPNPLGGGGVNVTGLPTGAQLTDYNTKRNASIMQYNLNVQQDLTHNFILTAGYIGSKARNLFIGQETSACNPTGQTANGYYIRNYTNPATCPTPNPALGSIVLRRPVGNSNYNSVEVSLDRGVGKYAMFRTAYTYSKCMDVGSYYTGNDAIGPNGQTAGLQPGSLINALTNRDYAPCDYDLRNNWTSNAIFTLPFTGARWKEGWQLTAIGSVHSGTPFSVYDGIDQANVGAGGAANNAERPDLVPGRSSNPTGKRVTPLGTFGFDPAAFQLQPVGVFGDLSRNTLTAFGVRELDMGVSKNTKVSEHTVMLVRAEGFNITNHTNLGFPNANLFADGPTNAQNQTAGQITSTATTSRQIQLSAKFTF